MKKKTLLLSSCFSVQPENKRFIIWKVVALRITSHLYTKVLNLKAAERWFRMVSLSMAVRHQEWYRNIRMISTNSTVIPYDATIPMMIRMDWPAYSPGMDPIEHVCDILCRSFASHILTNRNNSAARKLYFSGVGENSPDFP